MKKITDITTSLLALVFITMFSSCGNADKIILDDNATAIKSKNISFFGYLKDVEYDRDDNTLEFDIENTSINLEDIRTDFQSLCPVLLKHIFSGQDKERNLIARKVKSLNTTISFEFENQTDNEIKITANADEYSQYNSIIVDAGTELALRCSYKNQLYDFPITLKTSETVNDYILEDNNLVVTIAIDPTLVSTCEKNQGYFKQFGLDALAQALPTEAKLCKEGGYGVTFRYVGKNGRGIADVSVATTALISRF